MSDDELVALATLVQRETLSMDWTNKQREICGHSMAYCDDNCDTDLSDLLLNELKKRLDIVT